MNELILVIEDEPKVVKLARDYLVKNGFQVISATDGLSGLALARRQQPDLIILDLLLPGMDGRQVCRSIRAESDVPIIMLTALSEESDQIVGLELGADDYITKPFSPGVLVARVRSALRRSQNKLAASEVMRFGELEIDPKAHTVFLGNRPLLLTPTEFKLLVALATHESQTLSRQQLMDQVHGSTVAGFDRSIDSHIKNLRRKLDSDDERPPFIETVYGIGYRFGYLYNGRL